MKFTRTLSAVLTAGALLAAVAPAQVQVYGGAGERQHATRYFFGEKGPLGGVCIQYGQPSWNDDYNGLLETKGRGQNHRLGKDYWTTMHTDMALDIAGTKVPAGSYVLGLTIDNDGGMWLAILDAQKAFAAKAMPFFPQQWKVDMKAKFDHKKVEESAKKLTMTLDVVDGDKGKMNLVLRWGPHALTAPVTAHIHAKPTSRKSKAQG